MALLLWMGNSKLRFVGITPEPPFCGELTGTARFGPGKKRKREM
jgi:hypothetical protein